MHTSHSVPVVLPFPKSAADEACAAYGRALSALEQFLAAIEGSGPYPFPELVCGGAVAECLAVLAANAPWDRRPLVEVLLMDDPDEDEWAEGAPARIGSWAQAIDRSCCAESVCGECGESGLAYRPQHQGERYRALAVCGACGHETEF